MTSEQAAQVLSSSTTRWR